MGGEPDTDSRVGTERSPRREETPALPTQEGRTPAFTPEVLGEEEVEEVGVEEARVRMVHAMLEGISGPVRLSKRTGLDVKTVKRLIDDHEVARMWVNAKRNITQSGIDRLTGGIHQNIYILEELRKNRDPRVQMEASRDLLNRTPGMAPGAKVEIGEKAYLAMVEKYLTPVEKPPKKDDGSTSDK